jgi:hypothetical protein
MLSKSVACLTTTTYKRPGALLGGTKSGGEEKEGILCREGRGPQIPVIRCMKSTDILKQQSSAVKNFSYHNEPIHWMYVLVVEWVSFFFSSETSASMSSINRVLLALVTK